MSNNKQSARGSDNIQIAGNNNCVTNMVMMPQQQILTHSLIHELLDVFYSLPSSEDDSYSLQDPVQIHKKLTFNNAPRYKSIIDNHVDDYIRVDEVMKDYPNSEDIVKKLRDMFLKVADFNEGGDLCVGDGDLQLDNIKSSLVGTILADSKFDENKHPIEKIEHFCIALIAYGISKCKILETPAVKCATS